MQNSQNNGASERNNSTVQDGYQALVQAGMFEEVREMREVIRYRPTREGFDYVGIELNPDYFAIAKERIAHAEHDLINMFG